MPKSMSNIGICDGARDKMSMCHRFGTVHSSRALGQGINVRLPRPEHGTIDQFRSRLARSGYDYSGELVINTEIAYREGYSEPSYDDLPGGSDYYTPRVDNSHQFLDDEEMHIRRLLLPTRKTAPCFLLPSRSTF